MKEVDVYGRRRSADKSPPTNDGPGRHRAGNFDGKGVPVVFFIRNLYEKQPYGWQGLPGRDGPHLPAEAQE
jgi:hypothetical protein